MIQLSIYSQNYGTSTTAALEYFMDSNTRGNKCKLNQNHCRCDLRKHFLTSRIIAIWNNLPGYAVKANSSPADKHQCMQDIMYDYESHLTYRN